MPKARPQLIFLGGCNFLDLPKKLCYTPHTVFEVF